ncbi:MAG TPA: glycosyltransferase N-terminal domain-containing protein [Phnomibacter sp.]|nr:glycosyltransferase N-terminal domain-containing protein [Phnomibacter sp.]
MALFFYRIFLLLYKTSAAILAPFNPKVRKWILGRRNWKWQWVEKLSTIERKGKQPTIWMHASSLGEFEQGSPLLEALRQQWPESIIIVTFFSPSGYEVRKNYPLADAIGYLPFDSAWSSPAFVKRIQPDLVIWIKYEYWYYSLKAIADKKIPLLLVSGIFREDQPFFKWYGGLHRKMLGYFSHFFLQNKLSAQLISPHVPADKISIAGDTRFDSVISVAKNWVPNEAITNWLHGAETVIVAGSTWPSDEEELVHYAKTHSSIKWVIAPHHIDEDFLQETKSLFGNPTLYSQLPQANPDSNVLIIDNIGMLKYLYKYATICYVGGGFTGSGIHNSLEAAVYGKPVIHGPEFSKFLEAQGLLDAGASCVIESALELEETLNKLLANPAQIEQMGKAAAQFVHQHDGATAAILRYIQEKRLLIKP